MLIIIDTKVPEQAKEKLKTYGSLLELETSGITYEAISGHPDIFFHQADKKLIVAPNLPEDYKQQLDNLGIIYIPGEQGVGEKYPASSIYNAVSTKNNLIHNFRNTDSSITNLFDDADLIHVDQGYTRCNLLALDDDHYITSDNKVQRVLHRFDKQCLYVDPKDIILEDFSHGFFGGCCGIYEKNIFIIGSLKHLKEEGEIHDLTTSLGYSIIELYDGPLFDGGSILFI